MFIYKFLGSSAIIFCGAWTYIKLRQFQKMRLDQLESFISFISFVQKQIECFQLPIDTIIKRYGDTELKKCGISFTCAPSNIKEMLDFGNFYIDPRAKDLLYSFADEFGSSYASRQIESCERYIKELSQVRDKYIEKNEKDKKLAFALCLSASFSLIIIFI